jgi:hypothetical protein
MWLVKLASLKCTTRAPGGPDSASQGPQCHGECSARRSMPWGARTATASEGLDACVFS